MNPSVLSLLAIAAHLSIVLPASAQKPTVEQALQLKPMQPDVQFDRPDEDTVDQCRIAAEEGQQKTALVVRGPAGELLRRFVDSNADNKVDLWCYYQSGIEVYRDIDADFNGNADQYRWLGTAGTRWGLDDDEDGTVRETGIMFILFAPLAYVDVTSSWRFRSQWHRIHVAAAGMYVELAIAGIAAIVWSNTEGGWLSSMCFNTIVMASITTVMFNANPLMKFDGYYILSDALGMPNLYVNGQQYVSYWARRYLLGVPGMLPAWSRGHGIIIRIYGWTSLAWRIMTCPDCSSGNIVRFELFDECNKTLLLLRNCGHL